MKQFRVDLPLIPLLKEEYRVGGCRVKVKEIHVGKSEIMKKNEAKPWRHKPGTYSGSHDDNNYTLN